MRWSMGWFSAGASIGNLFWHCQKESKFSQLVADLLMLLHCRDEHKVKNWPLFCNSHPLDIACKVLFLEITGIVRHVLLLVCCHLHWNSFQNKKTEKRPLLEIVHKFYWGQFASRNFFKAKKILQQTFGWTLKYSEEDFEIYLGRDSSGRFCSSGQENRMQMVIQESRPTLKAENLACFEKYNTREIHLNYIDGGMYFSTILYQGWIV